MEPKFVWIQKIFGPKFFLTFIFEQHSLDLTIFLNKIFFGTDTFRPKVYGHGLFWDQIFCGQQKQPQFNWGWTQFKLT